MAHTSGPRLVVRIHAALAAASLAACGPGKPGTTEVTDSSATTDGATSTTTATDTTTTTTTPTTTGGTITKCADAKTEAACKPTLETDPDTGRGCRWGELRVATFPQADMCTLEVVGGVCELATFDEGGPGCFGFFREAGGGVIELVAWECGTPAGDAWEWCWDAPMDSPGFLPCACLNHQI